MHLRDDLIVPYLVEGIQQFRDQGTSLAGSTKHALETESVEVSDEAIGGGTESERVTPEVPLECDDGCGEHAGPDEGEGRLSPGEARVEERETRNHDQHHGRGHEDEGLVTRLVPLVQILGDCRCSCQYAGFFRLRRIPV